MASSGSSSVNAPPATPPRDQYDPDTIRSEHGLINIIDSSCAITFADPVDNIVTDDNFDTPSNTASFSDSGSTSYVSSSSKKNKKLDFLHIETKGSFTSSVYASPEGTKYWTPDVDEQYMPTIGSVYTHWEDAISMYKQYASKAGFEMRIGTHKSRTDPTNPNCKIPTHRYLICSKNGKPKRSKNHDSSLPPIGNQRCSRYTVSDCGAGVRFRYLAETKQFELYGFDSMHNHCMISSENVDLLRQNRQVGFETQQLIHRLSLNKIGPTVAHNIQVSVKGGPHNVQGTTVDFKNASRDIRTFIGERDANLFIDTLKSRSQTRNEFVVVDNELRSAFWADFVSIRKYEVFGDVCAFDTTYDTNKYKMIFVPFTGVDHHDRCVLFGAGLLYDETIESYTWLLQMFLKAHKKQPLLIISDQDASMKQAISNVFTESTHRLCMWHITNKLPFKISGDILANTNLRASFHKLVWNLFITVETFEERWHNLMKEYNLENHKWLSEMYAIRTRWAPCYFRDIPLCCLMKTTSRCESVNARFKVSSSDTNSLVQFLMCFDTSVDSQRYDQRKEEFRSDHSTPKFLTNLPIEVHASEIYTRNVFGDVQKEIQRGMFQCMSVERPDDDSSYLVRHYNKKRQIVNTFEVTINIPLQTIKCTCLGFERIGYLCRHVFNILWFNQVDRIPTKYISDRWKRDALPSSVFSLSHMYSTETNEFSTIKTEIIDLVTQCMNRMGRDKERLCSFTNQLRSIRDDIFKDIPNEPQIKPKTANISDILNIPVQSDSIIKPPMGIRNKGSGTKKRRVGPGEKIVKRRKRAVARLCNRCKKYVYDHDARNCEKVKAAKKAAYAAKCKAAAEANLPPPRYDVSDDEFDVEPPPRYVSSESGDDDEHDEDDVYETETDVTATCSTQHAPDHSAVPDQPVRRSSRSRRDTNYVYTTDSEDDS